MKKYILLIVIIILSFFVLKKYNQEIIIPEDAIRFRVVANSNSDVDQTIKNKVRVNLEKEIITKMNGVEKLSTAEKIIDDSMDELKNVVDQTLKKNDFNQNFNVSFGYNYFPEKKYKGVIYKEGKYKSLVITLGEGLGDNWWCVLFPPLCLIDASENDDTSELEYRFFIKDLIDKYF